MNDANDAEALADAASRFRTIGDGRCQQRAADGRSSAWCSIPGVDGLRRRQQDHGIQAHDCPICATRERYQLDEDTVPLRLIRHAELLRDMLRPRELDEVARDSAADLFTVPVTTREATDYLRWRGLLLQARRTVRDRQEVMDRLQRLTEEEPPRERMDERRANPLDRGGAAVAAASAAVLPGEHRSTVTDLRQRLRAADRAVVAPGSGAHGHVRSGSAAPGRATASAAGLGGKRAGARSTRCCSTAAVCCSGPRQLAHRCRAAPP